MGKNKKIVCSILILTILIYYVLGIVINNKIYATGVRQRTASLDGLTEDSYPAVTSLINELKTSHPNWTFTILYTGLDWNTAIYNETEALHGRSLVQTSSLPWLCSTCGLKAYDNGTWHCASKSTVSYYMDVRNWLNESYIFAFETLSYDESTQTIDGVKRILRGTFMDKDAVIYTDTEGNAQTINKSYAQIIMEAAKEVGISPYHLASRVKQEQGNGTSGLINGNYTYVDDNGNTCTDLVGYYNYFNIRATGGNTAAIIKNGLTYARSKSWTTPELAIKGGASFLASDYISNYQDCLYLEKYQVDSAGGLYSHQYMQNVSAPYSEGYSTYVAYRDLGMLDYSFNFIIPVFENMPQTASPMPNAIKMDIVTENVQVTTSYAALKIRQTASSSGTIVGSADKGTILLRIEKGTAMSDDGRYWDKVVYDTGTGIIVGYSARTDTDGAQYLTPVNDITTVNEEMQTSTDVNLRNGPGTSGTTIKQTLTSGIKLTVIDKMSYQVNGYYWYRIKLTDGTQGYMASEYLKAVGEPDVPDMPDNPEKYKLDENNLIIAPGTKITDIEGATLNGSACGTGATVTLNNNTYTLVIFGDISGDGIINSADLLKVVKHLNETAILEREFLRASDCNNDGKTNSADLLKIVKYLNETGNITI